MGTRADFYIGKGPTAKWLGSIAYDGYPSGIPQEIFTASTEEAYRQLVLQFISETSHGTFPKDGWPWPWEDSHLTDYAYTFVDSHVEGSCFGDKWFAVNVKAEDYGYSEERNKALFVKCTVCTDGRLHHPDVIHPDMRDLQKITLGPRSGVMLLSY